MEHIPTKTVLIVEDNIPTKERMEQIIIRIEDHSKCSTVAHEKDLTFLGNIKQ